VAKPTRIAVLGAGSIGGFVGGCWMAAGLPVTLIGRASFAKAVAAHGLELSDERGWSHRFTAEEVDFRTDATALADAQLIVLTVKSGATAEAAQQIAAHARPGTPVLSLQNGISNVDVLRDALGEQFPVIRGMVPYNVAYLGDGHFHKGVAGQLFAEDVPAMRTLSAAIGASPAGLSLCGDMLGLAWGKLLINLNNAVNALSGLTLVEELRRRGYRRVVAASQREGLALLDAAGIVPAKVGAVGPRLLPLLMVAPDWLFRHVFMRKWKIDAKARSSMADDLAQGRATEIDYINGELIALADRLGRHAPVNRRVVALVRAAETGGRHDWSPDELRRAVLGR
jgi:2-dehydropantoate 2-reductase